MATIEYNSGIGSGNSYGLEKYERFAFEALKSDAAYNGHVWKHANNGETVITVFGAHYEESALAEFVKSEFKAQHAKTGQSHLSMAKQITKYLTNIKTGDFFGNMADNI